MIELDPNDVTKELSFTGKEALEFAAHILADADPKNVISCGGFAAMRSLLEAALLAKMGTRDFQIGMARSDKFEVTIYNAKANGFA